VARNEIAARFFTVKCSVAVYDYLEAQQTEGRANMPRAVQFDHYGGIDVLQLAEVEKPVPKDREVVVRVKAAGINPGEAKIREGLLHSMFPASFPSGEGTDFAGIVDSVGEWVTKFKTGDEVAGYTHNRASQADYVLSDEANLTLKPSNVSWEIAGSLFVTGTTAYAAVGAVDIKDEDKVVVSGAAGGVGSIAVQLAKLKGARVFGIAGDHDLDWLRSLSVTPISYKGEHTDVEARIRGTAPNPSAFIDTVGEGYVKMAIKLKIKPERIDTIVDFKTAQLHGAKTVGGSEAASATVLKILLDDIASGSLVVPIAKTFKLEEVHQAFDFLEHEHHRGKVVLLTDV
jgi:NADPH:quinone reductase-like Zn-dependent oxidoreductase